MTRYLPQDQKQRPTILEHIPNGASCKHNRIIEKKNIIRIFSNSFILIRVTVNLEPIAVRVGARRENSSRMGRQSPGTGRYHVYAIDFYVSATKCWMPYVFPSACLSEILICVISQEQVVEDQQQPADELIRFWK